jgi:hypothetical protein
MSLARFKDYSHPMNYKKLLFRTDKAGFVLCVALLGTLTGCVGYVNRPPQGSVYVEPAVVVQDDYVYYPNYEVYYSSSRRQYFSLEGGAWISQPAPRGVSIDVLLASPSVRMNFHDSPANHYAEIARHYPRNWKPSGQKDKPKDDRHDEHGDNNGR